MSAKTGIEWTDATWNPTRGCTRVSPGCQHCYAETVAARFSGPGMPYEGLARSTPSGARWTGELRLIEKHLLDPIRWQKPRRIFVNSMSDLFHERVPDEWLDRIFAIMAAAPQHTFQVLTKRPGRMREYMHGRDWSAALNRLTHERIRPLDGDLHLAGEIVPPLPNVWLGVSVEDQARAVERIPELIETPAAVRFLSCEPLLGPVDITPWLWGPAEPCKMCPLDIDCECGWNKRSKLHWTIVGGESGRGARPMHPEWAGSLRDQCLGAGVPFFFKQWGEWGPEQPAGYCRLSQRGGWTHETVGLMADGRHYEADKPDDWQHSTTLFRSGKKAAGRELDGRLWNEFPVRA